MSKIILSLCLSGRNDNYGHDFKRRFTQAMNFMAWSAKRAGVLEQIEVVFTDWNSERPIAQDLILSEDATKMVRFIEVPPDIATAHNESLSPFQQSIAFNVAFRRARGIFMGIMPADILLTSYSLRNLLSVLNKTVPVSFDLESSVIAVPRKNLPYFVQENDYFTRPEQIEKCLLAGDPFMLCDNTARGMMGGYGTFILGRQLLHELRGVDERIAGWGYNDIDIALRCADKAVTVNTGGYGIVSYDFEPSYKMLMQKENRKTDFWEIKPGTAENPENWGLSDLVFHERQSENTVSELSYPVKSPIAEDVSWRDWILWLSQHIPATVVPKFSAAALAAGWCASKNTIRQTLIYGTGDRSVFALLSLTCPLSDLVIAELFPDGETFARVWQNDNQLGPFHYQGHVHYLPTLETIHEQPFNLVIVDDRYPDPEVLKGNCNEKTTIIFSAAASARIASYQKVLADFKFKQTSVYGIIVLSPETLNALEAYREWKPMNGNIATTICMCFKRHFSKISKMKNILMRQPFFTWGHALRVIQKIRKHDIT